MGQNTIAVTEGESVHIYCVTDKIYQEKEISLKDKCHGVVFEGQNLIVNCQKDGLKVVNLDGSFIRRHTQVTGRLVMCIDRNQNLFYVDKSLSLTEIVLVHLPTSKSSLIDSPYLKDPTDITIDKNGNVFVAVGNAIYVLPEGNTFCKNAWVHVIN